MFIHTYMGTFMYTGERHGSVFTNKNLYFVVRYKYGAIVQNFNWALPKTFKGKYNLHSFNRHVIRIKQQVFVNEQDMK